MTTDKSYMRRNAEMHMVPLAKNEGGRSFMSFRNKALRGCASRKGAEESGIRTDSPNARRPSTKEPAACSVLPAPAQPAWASSYVLAGAHPSPLTREACPRQGAEVTRAGTRQHVICSFIHRAPASSEEINLLLLDYSSIPES